MANYSQQQANFIATELPFAQRESARTGIPVAVFLTQSANETGWGTSAWFRQSNNPAGIGVTGAAGAGHSFPNLSTAFRAYADKLMGIGEAGQEKFKADVQAGASTQQLLTDIEQGPWAAGHYGGTGLNQLAATYGLEAFNAPGAKAPTGSTPIHTVAYIPGTHVHIPTSPAGGAIDPTKSSVVQGASNAVLGPLIDLVKSTAVRAALVLFGAAAILIGLALLVRDTDQHHQENESAREAGREESVESRSEEPAERARPQAPAPAQGMKRGGSGPGGGAVSKDVSQTGSGAEDLGAAALA